MGTVLIGYISVLLAYLYLQFTNPAYNRDGMFSSETVFATMLNTFRSFHPRNPSFCIPNWASNGEYYLEPSQEWRVHTFYGHGMGTSAFKERSPRPVRRNDSSLSTGTVCCIWSMNGIVIGGFKGRLFSEVCCTF